MGDRCYMSITCRRQDAPRFEALGFTNSSEVSDHDDSPVVSLEDCEANYAHYNDLPTDIPWHGYSCAGGDYGASNYACDGETLDEVEVGHNNGYVLPWLDAIDGPDPQAVAKLRSFIALEKKVLTLFALFLSVPRSSEGGEGAVIHPS